MSPVDNPAASAPTGGNPLKRVAAYARANWKVLLALALAAVPAAFLLFHKGAQNAAGKALTYIPATFGASADTGAPTVSTTPAPPPSGVLKWFADNTPFGPNTLGITAYWWRYVGDTVMHWGQAPTDLTRPWEWALADTSNPPPSPTQPPIYPSGGDPSGPPMWAPGYVTPGGGGGILSGFLTRGVSVHGANPIVAKPPSLNKTLTSTAPLHAQQASRKTGAR